jgi:long-subunit acyl-CoA synthetase (AMP-forming)
VAAQRARRRAQRAPLHPDGARAADHRLRDPRKIAELLPEVHPNWFFAVPRIWEKIKAGLQAMVGGLEGEQGEKIRGALDAAIQKVRLEQEGKEVPAELAEAVKKADEEVFSNVRAMLGLDQLEACNVGAAPTPPEVLEFFHAIGVPIAELWGMSETCGYGTTNPPRGRIKIGHRRPAGARVRGQARRGRRAAVPRPVRHARLPQPRRQDQGDARPTTAG